jgi:hypothetical protein
MTRLKAKDYKNLNCLKFCYRYIDDITVLNDNDSFQYLYKDIYPSCLNLKKVNTVNSEADILDITVSIANGQADTKTYDKRNDFSFDVKIFPHFHSNIHSKIFFNTLYGQIERHARICSTTANFCSTLDRIFQALYKRGYTTDYIRIVFIKCMRTIKKFGHWRDLLQKVGL